MEEQKDHERKCEGASWVMKNGFWWGVYPHFLHVRLKLIKKLKVIIFFFFRIFISENIEKNFNLLTVFYHRVFYYHSLPNVY